MVRRFSLSYLFLAILAGLFLPIPAHAQPTTTHPFVHPGMYQTRADLDFMKQKVLAGEEPWKSAFDRFQAAANPEFEPEPFTHVIRGPYGRPAIGGSQLSASADAAYQDALIWYVTGNKAAAAKAIQCINAWSNTLWDFDDNDSKLLAGWTGHTWCNAAEILRCTDSGWQQKDIDQFKHMLMTAYYPLIKDFFPEANGNWDNALMDTTLCIAVFCDDHAMFDKTINHFYRGEGNGGIGEGNGGITRYVYPTGQCQESTRDASHTQLGMGELALACQVAWNQGVDLFGSADNRLALGFEYSAKYYHGEEVPVQGVISARPGNLSDIYELVAQHYRYISGLDMHYTTMAAEYTRPRSTKMVLTFYKGPLADSPQTPTGPPQPSPLATECGALAAPSAQPPADAIKVSPGANIQTALDAAAKSGGWVVLSRGSYTLPSMLHIASGVTLSGQGLSTILFLDPKLTADRTGTAIVNATDDLHDVTIRDLAIEGATSLRPGTSDPNQDRRMRETQMAPARGGISFLGQKDGQIKNIDLEHLTVRNCTRSGVTIEGAAQVTITDCDFSDSGSSVVPGPGIHHNLRLSHIIGAQITGSRFDTSLWGDGVSLIASRNVTISKNEMARNAEYGVHAADCQDVHITGNLTEGNHTGIQVDTIADGCRDIEVRDNLTRNNALFGIDVTQTTGGAVQNNTESDNGQPDQIAVTASN